MKKDDEFEKPFAPYNVNIPIGDNLSIPATVMPELDIAKHGNDLRLVCMRASDMKRVKGVYITPGSTDDRVCMKCGEHVHMAPSTQRIVALIEGLGKTPNILCATCLDLPTEN